MEFGAVNYLAVLVAGVVGSALGALWYSKALFWNAWLRETGLREEAVQRAGWKPMIVSMIGGLVIAYGIARLMSAMNVEGYWWGGFLAVLISITIVAPIMLSQVMHQGQSMKLFCIDFGYRFIEILVAGIIIGVW